MRHTLGLFKMLSLFHYNILFSVIEMFATIVARVGPTQILSMNSCDLDGGNCVSKC